MLFISFDETDDLAHAGKYHDHLRQLQAIDGFLADLWTTLQATPHYAGKTTLLVTTDHGRGHTPKARWKDHGTKTPDSYQMWLAVMGPGTPATGEQTGGEVLLQQQIAATIARLMGYDFRAEHTVAPVIPAVFR